MNNGKQDEYDDDDENKMTVAGPERKNPKNKKQKQSTVKSETFIYLFICKKC